MTDWEHQEITRINSCLILTVSVSGGDGGDAWLTAFGAYDMRFMGVLLTKEELLRLRDALTEAVGKLEEDESE